ncbi:hypothetical protein Hanom_Chr17g01538741 [Helianthus anomalus]
MSFPTFFIATLDTNLRQMPPTAIGLIPLSGFNKGVRGAEATNSANTLGQSPSSHRLTTPVMAVSRPEELTEPSQPIASNKCWARIPSLPQDVPLGKDWIHLSTQSSTAITVGWTMGLEGNNGGGTTGCLSIRAFMVDSPKGATPLEHKTLTAAVKCPSLTFRRHCLILGSFLLSSPLPESLLGTPTSSPLFKREETKSVKSFGPKKN